MCGRVVTASGPEELSEYLGADAIVDVLDGPDHNVAPSRRLPLAWTSDEDGGRLLGTARWGLVPGWAKDPAIGDRMFNARAETVADKPSFRAAFRRRRCLVAVDGFYEWGPGTPSPTDQRPDNGRTSRQPWYIHRVDGHPLVLAGLWERWVDTGSDDRPPGTEPSVHGPSGDELRTCTVITVPANGDLSPVHHRMPAVLESVEWDAWLDTDDPNPSDLECLLAPAADGTLSRHPVHRRVNNARNKGADLLDLVDPAPVDAPSPLTDQGALW
jgi:putative SOS response-associated peptidase YedK